MRLAKVVNNKIVNIIVGDTVLDGYVDVTGTPAQIGWVWDGLQFVPPPPSTLKNVYTLGRFIRELTDDEYGVIEELAQTTRRARRILAFWRENGVDFNDDITVQAVTWLVQNTEEWTPARAQLLAG